MSLALSRMLHDRFLSDAGTGDARPPTDWKETPEAHVFRMDVPGLTKEQVAVEVVDGRVLRVRGGGHEEKKAEEEESDDDDGAAVRWHCRERVGSRSRAFETQFRLPEDAAADDVRAAMADGVLTVTVPKRKGGGKKRRHHGGDKLACCRFWP